MELVLELVFEAGVRLPSPVGQTIGIVGAVVLGQAAVSAQLVSPILGIVVAISAIASFMVPLYVRRAGRQAPAFSSYDFRRNHGSVRHHGWHGSYRCCAVRHHILRPTLHDAFSSAVAGNTARSLV